METEMRLVALHTLVILQIFCLLSGTQEVGGILCRMQQCFTDGSALASPVCGSDRRTYSSRCLLQFAKCKGHRVRMVHKGKCKQDARSFPLQQDVNLVSPLTSKCFRDRQQALSNALSKDLIMLGVFVPKCEADGSYCQVQCLNTSRYCWCVDSTGKEIQGTRVRLSQPNCPSLAHTQPPDKPAAKSWKSVKPCTNCKGCPKDVRSVFNEKLVKFLSEEFMAYVQRSSLTSAEKVQGQSGSMGKAHLLLWKFMHLDTNADYLLDIRELHGFLKITKKSIHPKKCSRTFVAYCDKDRDHKISLNEWYTCFGVKEIKKCTGEYRAALKSRQHSSRANQPYLPRCAIDGSYYPTQCHDSIGYCWCVNPDTGKPIPGTTTKSASLDCWKYVIKDNSTGSVKKECAQDLWISFKRQMLKLFRKDVEEDSPTEDENESETLIRNQRRSARSGDLRFLGTFLSDNQVLIWKFNRLDHNRDKLLVSNEFLTSTMKKILGNIKRGRKCGKKLLMSVISTKTEAYP
ncbi:SPARC- modular calcium-binding protein 2 [Desmophyllum pertusum]|uniref:SPARC- modular calcium-binding protein 2 n=1 Tax=Desmophyllum pertusum TaxID=174260 RepID=A0A9W9YJ25_9CNID|nr:SPARC- modular calcium-binding protein 2 [Desmophyllum pertusum]